LLTLPRYDSQLTSRFIRESFRKTTQQKQSHGGNIKITNFT